MANVQASFNAPADESQPTQIVDYVVDSTDDINATPPVWTERAVVPADGSVSYVVSFPHPTGVHSFRCRSRDVDGEFNLNPLIDSLVVADILPADPSNFDTVSV